MSWKPLSAAMLVACGLIAALPTDCVADDHFRERVAPVLQRRCLSCHNDQQNQGDFSLQTVEHALAGGHIEPGDAAASHLIDLITPVDGGTPEMPKDADPLTNEEIAEIRTWIDQGAAWPRGMVLEEPTVNDLDWWSFKPMERWPVPEFPAVPMKGGELQVAELPATWVRTPIDAFILRTLQQKGLSPAEAADRRTLIRRVTYDLIGLPPTPERSKRSLPATRSTGLRETRRSIARIETLRRTLGTALVGCRQVRRYLRIRQRQAATERLALSRLRDPVVQRRQTLRAICPGTDRRRRVVSGRDGRNLGSRFHRRRAVGLHWTRRSARVEDRRPSRTKS